MEYTVYQDRQETIQVVLDSKLLRATEVGARRTKLNRSALIRDALRAHLKDLAIHERELRHRKGYEAGPSDSGDWSGGTVTGDIRLYVLCPRTKPGLSSTDARQRASILIHGDGRADRFQEACPRK